MSEEITPSDVASTIVHEGRHLLLEAMKKLRHCVGQLNQEQIWYRDHEEHASIGNLILHLTGNLNQWIVSGLGGAEFQRDRAAEFAERGPIPVDELMNRLETVVNEAMYTLSHLNPAELLARRTIQGFDVTTAGAIMHSIPHFVGHTHQIVFATRLILKDQYRYQWAPGKPSHRVPI